MNFVILAMHTCGHVNHVAKLESSSAVNLETVLCCRRFIM